MLLRDSEGLGCKTELVRARSILWCLPIPNPKETSPAIQLLAALASKDLAGLFCFDFTESAPPIKASS